MIGFAGPNLPLELLKATGRNAGPLSFDPARTTPRADQWLEAKFAPWAAPLLETWVAGGFDHLDQVLFSRADDTSQRLYYYLCELQRRGLVAGPEPLICDIAKIPRATSCARTIDKLRDLAKRLGVGSSALEQAIVEANRRRDVVASPDDRVCLLYGTPSSDHRLHDAITAGGYFPVGQTLMDSWSDLGPAVDEGTGDPVEALGRQLHLRQGGARSFADPAHLMRDAIAKTEAKVAVVWRIEEDEAQTWHLPAERRVLAEAGIPHLVLTRRDWLARDGAAAEITAFLQGVEA